MKFDEIERQIHKAKIETEVSEIGIELKRNDLLKEFMIEASKLTSGQRQALIAFSRIE